MPIMSQMSILRLFCTHLVEFASEVAAIFPHDADIRATKVFLQGLKKINPKALAAGWHDWVGKPYRGQIENGDFEFFVNKDYTHDIGVGTSNNSKEILKSIDIIRAKIRLMSDDNRAKSMKYIQNLTKLGDMYFSK